MLGTVLGDLVGSAFEFSPVQTKDFEFLGRNSHFTVGTVMTLASALGYIKGYANPKKTRIEVTASMKQLGNQYNTVPYERNFAAWLKSNNPKPYMDSGVDAALRIAPCAWLYNSLKYVEYYAEISAKITHANPESVKAAKAVASTIFLARQGVEKDYIQRYITDVYYYDLSRTSEELRKTNVNSKEAKDIFPVAFAAFYEGESFEDSVRIAVSMGSSNSNEIAALAGCMAEAAHPIPDELVKKISDYLTDDLNELCDDYRQYLLDLREKREVKFKNLMDCKPFFDKRAKTEWYAPKPVDNVSPFPYPKYGEEVNTLEQFVQDMDFGDFKYEDTLLRYGFDNAELKEYMEKAKTANTYLLKAMLTHIVRQERFVDGNIADAVRYGVISEILDELFKKANNRMF